MMSEVKKYRKKPVVVEAIQFTGEIPFPKWVGLEPSNGKAYVTTVHLQKTYIEVGDWLIKEPGGGELYWYPCKPDAFEATYDPA